MGCQILLIEDVDDLGKSGDLVSVKPGYARNYLLPQQKGLFADKSTLRLQAQLQEERAKKAVVEKQEAEELAAKIGHKDFTIAVKVDHEGHMYGSVTVHDIIRVIHEAESVQLERRNILLPHPIKTLGKHDLKLRLKEGVTAEVYVHVVNEASA